MYDIIIIGAGASGLCAAKTFLEYDGSTNLLIIDDHTSLGGVWSKEQLYPTLKTNNLFSTVDYSDFPMDQRFGVKPGEHVTGEAMNAYYHAYASHFRLTDKLQFNTKVVEVSRLLGSTGWVLQTVLLGKDLQTLECKKLVVATGVLNVPHMPELKGVESFGAPITHFVDLGRRSDELFKMADIKSVTVIGGSKSAYDSVYLAATTGHKVDWIIRKSGRGPVWVFPAYTMLGPVVALREKLVTRRFFSFMSPSIFPEFSGFAWIRSFLHSTSVGKFISQKFWGTLHSDTLRDCGYRSDPKFHVLEPEQNPFWYGTSSGVLNYDTDFFSLVKSGQVQIHREDLSHLSDHTVHLANGTEFHSDALVAATGFSAKPTLTFQPASIQSDLGVPTTSLDQTQTSFWAEVDSKADLAIGSQFPRLLVGPFSSPSSSVLKPYHPGMNAEVSYTPWRLYRGIAPPGLTADGDRSLVFLGMFSNLANTVRLETQCLWALAYLNAKLPGVDKDVLEGRVFEETALFQRYTQLRAPYGHGRFYPDLVFDQMAYWELLLHDLGLPVRRKANFFRELFAPYGQEDYRGIVKEWMAKVEGK